jgi:EpsI family protein
VIQKGGQKQIVYYWFKQRDRWIANEYAVKFFLFWDSLTRHRADGALVRLVSGVHAGETEAVADGRLQTMAGLVTPLLGRYIPD